MATISLIGFEGKAIRPHGAGWLADGVFFANWSHAVSYLRDGHEPNAAISWRRH